MPDATPLLVAVLATDEAQRNMLTRLVAAAGHQIIASGLPDVIVSDERQASTWRPTILLSDKDSSAENRLPTTADPKQVDAALRAVAAGLSIRIARPARRRSFEEIADTSAQQVLTPRELDVIDAIGSGLSNKAIARQLGISLHTVKFHIESLLRKLGAHTRAEAVAKALERRRKETIEL